MTDKEKLFNHIIKIEKTVPQVYITVKNKQDALKMLKLCQTDYKMKYIEKLLKEEGFANIFLTSSYSKEEPIAYHIGHENDSDYHQINLKDILKPVMYKLKQY